MRDMSADVFLGFPVVNGDVNVVYAGIKYRVQDRSRLLGRHWPSHARHHPPQLQRAEAQRGNAQPGASQYSCRQVRHGFR